MQVALQRNKIKRENYLYKIETIPVLQQNYYILLLPVQNHSALTDFTILKSFISHSSYSQFSLSDSDG